MDHLYYFIQHISTKHSAHLKYAKFPGGFTPAGRASTPQLLTWLVCLFLHQGAPGARGFPGADGAAGGKVS